MVDGRGDIRIGVDSRGMRLDSRSGVASSGGKFGQNFPPSSLGLAVQLWFLPFCSP